MPSIARLLVIAQCVWLMMACSTAPVSSVWIDSGSTPSHYGRLVVFGVTDNPKVRRAYEDNFVGRLQRFGVRATAGHTLVSDKELRWLVRLTEAYSKVKADGVLITHLVSDESA